MTGPPAHPAELTCPCCLPALGEFSEMPPHGGLAQSLGEQPSASKAAWISRGTRRPVPYPTEDSPSGLWRSLGKRVGCKPSGVRIPYPPPPEAGSDLRERRPRS